MKDISAKQGHIRTSTSLNDCSSFSGSSKRRKIKDNVSETMMFATGGSGKTRSDKDEGEVRELTPSSPLDTRSESTPSFPKRFFTDDGEELVTTALHLSRRDLRLEKWRRLIIMEKPTAQPPPKAKDQSPSSLNSPPSGKTNFHSPPPEEPAGSQASQSSYGGDSIEEFADEVLAGEFSAVMTSPQNTTAADQRSSSKENPALIRHE